MARTTTLKEFESVFPKLVEDLLDHAKSYKLPEEFVNWYKAVGTNSLSAQAHILTSICSLSTPTQLGESATAECLYRTPFPCSLRPLSPKSNISKLLRWDG